MDAATDDARIFIATHDLLLVALPGGCAPAKAANATSRLTNETVFVDTGSPSSCA